MNRGTIVVKVGKLPGKSKTSSWCNTEFHHQKFYVVLQFISTFKTKPKKKKNEEKQPAKKLSSCEYLAACSELVSTS